MGLTAPYRQHNYLGEYANDTEVLAFIQANKWDSSGDGAGTPQNGMTYHNTSLDMDLTYDGGRSKWLTIGAPVPIQFGRKNSTAAGSYYQAIDGLAMSASLGYVAPWAGTVVAIAYTRSDTDSATFEVVKGGAAFSPVAELASTAVSGRVTTVNSDFAAGDVLAVRNKSGGNTTSDVAAWLFVKFRGEAA